MSNPGIYELPDKFTIVVSSGVGYIDREVWGLNVSSYFKAPDPAAVWHFEVDDADGAPVHLVDGTGDMIDNMAFPLRGVMRFKISSSVDGNYPFVLYKAV